jgi:hypothetical protein
MENPHILCLQREKNGQKLTGLFNFSGESQNVFQKDLCLEPYGFRVIKQE